MLNYPKKRSDFIQDKKSSDRHDSSSGSKSETDYNYIIKDGWIFLSYAKITQPLHLSKLNKRKRTKRVPDRYGDFLTENL